MLSATHASPSRHLFPGTIISLLCRAGGSGPAEAATSGTPVEEEIREQLDRILDSKAFETSQRNRGFLRYVVEETLAGRADRIKAYSVATVVFGRDPDFDPQTDPIIRIEASRLRRAIDHYYLAAGGDDPVRIMMPKGSYVPLFEYSDQSAAMGGQHGHVAHPATPGRRIAAASRALLIASVAALATAAAVGTYVGRDALMKPLAKEVASTAPLEVRGVSISLAPIRVDGMPSNGRELVDSLVGPLTRFPDLNVFASNGAAIARSDYALSARGLFDRGELRVSVALADPRSGQQLWSARYQIATDDPDLAIYTLGARVVRAVAGPHGVILADQARGLAARQDAAVTPRECVLLYRLADWRPRVARQSNMQDCLMRATETAPSYASAHAALALAEVEAIAKRAAPTGARQTTLADALASAQRAIDLDPRNTLGYQALHRVKWAQGEVEQSVAAATHALEINPNDLELMAELGFRYSLLGAWQRAEPLLRQAYGEDPYLPSRYRQGTALRLYVQGRYDDALAEARRIDLPDAVLPYVLRTIAAAKLGLMAEVNRSRTRILAIEPRIAETLPARLEADNVPLDLIRIIVDGLRDAGVEIRGQMNS